MKRSPDEGHIQKNTKKINEDILTVTKVLVNQKKVDVYEHMVKMTTHDSFK